MMAIIDPFDTPAEAPKGIIDPFETTDTAPPASRAWADVPLEAVKNIPSSAYHLGEGLVKQAVGTAKTMAPYMVMGPALGPATAAIDAGKALYSDPDMVKRFGTAAWKALVERYGSEEAIKKTIATDPLGFAMDAATIVQPGASLARRGGRAVAEIGRAADVSRPFHEIPRAPEPPPPLPPPVPSETELAQQQLAQAGTPMDLPRALTTPNRMVQAGSVALSKAPVIGTPLDEAVRAVPAQMGAGVEALAQRHGPALPENIIGGGIEQTLTGAATREAAAAKTAAETEHAARLQAWEAENLAREQAITTRQAEANAAATRTFGDVAPMEMAQDTIGEVQAAHRQALARQNQLYGNVNALDARVSTDAFHGLRDRAEQALVTAGHTIDDPGTNAAKMLREVDRLSGRPGELPPNVPPRLMQALEKEYGGNVPPSVLEGLGFPGGIEAIPPDFRLTGTHAPAPGSNAISVQGLEKLSTRLGRMVRDAETPSDRAASITVKKSFEDWRNDILDSHLTPDSEPGARAVIDTARAAYSDRMNRFGHNYRQLPEGEQRAAAKNLNQIVTGGLGPEGLRDNLIGAKPGNRRVSGPLFEAISGAVPNAAEFRNRLRGAYWNEIGGGSPEAIARNVEGLTPTRMGSHLFDPAEHDLMRQYAQLSQQTPAQLAEAARLAKQNTPKPAKVEPGKAEQLAGEAIKRSEEKTLGAFDSALREGGNIKQAARIWGRMTEANRNEVRSNFLRNLGGGGKEFSVAEFVKNWDSYSDQAKTFLLPDRAHRNTIKAIHTLAKEYGATLSRYGNPSGTAQVSFWHKLMTGGAKTAAATVAGTVSYFHPIGMAFAGLGGYGISKLLASPQGARQLTRWAGMTKAYNSAPSATKLLALQNATRLLAQSAEDKK